MTVNHGLEVGQTIEFFYPRHNYGFLPQKFEKRRLKIERIRDLASEPIDPLTLTLDPFLRRSRTLVIGTDLAKREERSFYLDSMEDVHRVTNKFRPDSRATSDLAVAIWRGTAMEVIARGLSRLAADGLAAAIDRAGEKAVVGRIEEVTQKVTLPGKKWHSSRSA